MNDGAVPRVRPGSSDRLCRPLAHGSPLPLTCLAPDIIEAILDGRQPKGLRLAEVLGNGPLDWGEQRMSWGTRFADREVMRGLRTDERGPVA